MGSLESLWTYWTSPPALAVLTAFLAVGFTLFLVDRRRFGTDARLRMVRAGTWLAVAFWTFVAASTAFCYLLADPVEYTVGVAKAVSILSISMAIGIATFLASALSRGARARAPDLPMGGWLPHGHPIQDRIAGLGAHAGLAEVRSRLVPGPPLAVAEPPDTIVVSQGLLDVLSDEELDAVVLHELCHLCKRDGPEKAFTGAMRRILFFDPILRALDSVSRRERELRADEWVANQVGSAPLASALQKIVAVRGTGGELARTHPLVEDRLARLVP